jgi:hypothetical protein
MFGLAVGKFLLTLEIVKFSRWIVIASILHLIAIHASEYGHFSENDVLLIDFAARVLFINGFVVLLLRQDMLELAASLLQIVVDKILEIINRWRMK